MPKPNVVEGTKCRYCTDCGAEWSVIMSEDLVPEVCPHCLPEWDKMNVTAVFTQDGEHVHSWETGLDKMQPKQMIEAAFSSGLVDDKKPLEFIVYDDDQEEGVESVLMKGEFHPLLLV